MPSTRWGWPSLNSNCMLVRGCVVHAMLVVNNSLRLINSPAMILSSVRWGMLAAGRR